MCLPDLDGPSVFGALLDPAGGGRFELAPDRPFTSERRYLQDTNVLETTFTTDDGVVRVTDALTLDKSEDAPARELVRHVEPVSGQVTMAWRFDPRPGYGAAEPHVELYRGAAVVRHGSVQIGLQTWEAGTDESGVAGQFTVGGDAGTAPMLVMQAVHDAPLPLPARGPVQRRLKDTIEVWRSWVRRTSYDGPWGSAVRRSLLALRLLTDGRTGAIAAAGTTSLPEVLGGERNYDYRFAWVRDASFSLDALMAVGMEQLAQSSVCWLLRAVRRTHPRVDPVYTLGGNVLRSESELDLPGYRFTRPVLIGNKAGGQLQLGGFGDLIETVHAFVANGHVLSPADGERLADIVDLLCRIWRREDSGLWELPQTAHYGTSKLGCWVAVQRLLELAEAGIVPSRHVASWRRERDAMREFIEQRLWSDQRRSYVEKAGSESLDCGVLLAGRRGFTDPRGERFHSTIEAIRHELSAGGPLLYRYSGMQSEENAFLACSFWMVEALALAGRVQEAVEMMDALVALGNDVGLYTEEMEPDSHALMGNFPQALTHLALITAAVAIGRAGQTR
jgi:GH15 family glucan-1,4-alpha-glucosidase